MPLLHIYRSSLIMVFLISWQTKSTHHLQRIILTKHLKNISLWLSSHYIPLFAQYYVMGKVRKSCCSLWEFNLFCVILQISLTNDCMPLTLLTSLISPNITNFHQSYPTRKDKSFTLLLCWITQLIQYLLIRDKNPVTSWECFELHIFNTDLLSAKLQHSTPLLTAQTVRFISDPLMLSLSGRSTGICLFTPITLYGVFPLLTRTDKVPEVRYPHGLITE